ncbi:MAG: plastocyanin/azurin family copper-binding protein [Flavobacteriales bacterium]
MRTVLLIFLLSIASIGEGQVTHLIRGLDFYYLPDTLWMQPGDSVHFQTAGIHDMVQTDSAYWAIGQAIGNGGFHTTIGADTTFVIDTAGTYYFVCSPHGIVGMRGVLIVDGTVGLERAAERDGRVRLYPVPAADHMFVHVDRAALAGIVDISGRLVGPFMSFDAGRSRIDLAHLDPGQYLILLHWRDGTRTTARFSVSARK